MIAIQFTSPVYQALKKALVATFPDVKSSHLSEALAFAVGFQTHAAALTAIDGIAPENSIYIELKLPDFCYRLEQLDYPGMSCGILETRSFSDLVLNDIRSDQVSDETMSSIRPISMNWYEICVYLKSMPIGIPAYLTSESLSARLKVIIRPAPAQRARHEHMVALAAPEADRIPPPYLSPTRPVKDAYAGTVSFRAECRADVDELIKLIDANWPKSFSRDNGDWVSRAWNARFTCHHVKDPEIGPLPDVHVEMVLQEPMTIRVLHDAMKMLPVGHVMLETLRACRLSENSLTRRYSDVAPKDCAEQDDEDD